MSDSSLYKIWFRMIPMKNRFNLYFSSIWKFYIFLTFLNWDERGSFPNKAHWGMFNADIFVKSYSPLFCAPSDYPEGTWVVFMAYYQPLQKHGSKSYFFYNTICGYDYISLKAVNMRAQIIIEYVDHRLHSNLCVCNT